jgi:Zn-dependent metalloprotease
MHLHRCTSHRHSICCLLPPHVLHEVARRGTTSQRDAALSTIAADATHRVQRMAGQPPAPPVQADTPITPGQVQRTIYATSNTQDLPGALARAEGHPVADDQSINEAYDALGHTFDFFLTVYNRDSIDNRGLPLVATVHYDHNYNNALWNGHQMVFGDGDGEVFNRLTGAIDVIGHELTHGVTASEVNLSYTQQSGALNESISDVFGSLLKQYVLKQTAGDADWLIGSGLLKVQGQALRSLKAPGTAYNNDLLGEDPQPANMAHYVHTGADDGGVHINSGIPNHAFYLVAAAIGGCAWEKAGQIWYDTIRDRSLKRSADFAAFASCTIANAGTRYGAGSGEQKAVIDAWKAVGVPPV